MSEEVRIVVCIPEGIEVRFPEFGGAELVLSVDQAFDFHELITKQLLPWVALRKVMDYMGEKPN